VRSPSRSITKLAFVVVALAALVLPAAASAQMRVRGIDTSNYPTIRATVISSAGPSVRPAVTEDGNAVTAMDAVNLANSKSVVLPSVRRLQTGV
jgi:hypothetical protein